jgi:hypothetical protein
VWSEWISRGRGCFRDRVCGMCVWQRVDESDNNSVCVCVCWGLQIGLFVYVYMYMCVRVLLCVCQVRYESRTEESKVSWYAILCHL